MNGNDSFQKLCRIVEGCENPTNVNSIDLLNYNSRSYVVRNIDNLKRGLPTQRSMEAMRLKTILYPLSSVVDDLYGITSIINNMNYRELAVKLYDSYISDRFIDLTADIYDAIKYYIKDDFKSLFAYKFMMLNLYEEIKNVIKFSCTVLQFDFNNLYVLTSTMVSFGNAIIYEISNYNNHYIELVQQAFPDTWKDEEYYYRYVLIDEDSGTNYRDMRLHDINLLYFNAVESFNNGDGDIYNDIQYCNCMFGFYYDLSKSSRYALYVDESAGLAYINSAYIDCINMIVCNESINTKRTLSIDSKEHSTGVGFGSAYVRDGQMSSNKINIFEFGRRDTYNI